jgi:hypothetical protein
VYKTVGATTLTLTVASIIHPPLLDLVPLALVGGLTALGTWRLWSQQRTLAARTTPAIDLPGTDLDDDCELATFSALQDASELVSEALDLVEGRPGSELLVLRGRALLADVDAFVFSGDGVGDLATAWSLEHDARHLADHAAQLTGRHAA